MQSRKILNVLLAVAASIPLDGYSKDLSSPTSVTLTSLEKGINSYLASLDQCITVATKWPAKTTTGTNTYMHLESLVDTGLLSVETTRNAAIFTPTNDGNAVFVAKDGVQKLCVPAPTVVKITRETLIKEPGMEPVTEVAFTYSVKSVPTWAKNKKVKKAFAFISERADNQLLTETQYFHRTADGWEVVRDGNSKFFGDTIKPMRPM